MPWRITQFPRSNGCLRRSTLIQHQPGSGIPQGNQQIFTVGAAGREPTPPGFGVRKRMSHRVSAFSIPLQNTLVKNTDLSCMSPRIAPFSQQLGATVVQRNFVADRRSAPKTGQCLTIRDVASRLRLSTATVYRLCESGKLNHLRVRNAIRIAEFDLLAFIQVTCPQKLVQF
jgi:excisionase family DNA binding protein